EPLCGAVDRISPFPRQPSYPQLVRFSRTASSSFEYLLENKVVAVEPGVLLAQAGDRAAGVQDRGVVAVAEGLADLRQAHLGEVLRERHGNLPWPRHVAVALFRMHVRDLDLEVLGDGLLDPFYAHLAARDVEDVAQGFLGEVERELARVETREGEHLLQRAFELAHVRPDVLGDEKGDV